MRLEDFYASRSIEHQPFGSACYAPFVGMSFDMHGTVSVCAFTRTTPMGRVGEVALVDMWNGRVVDELRRAVRSDDLLLSCSRCAEEIAGGNLHGVLATGFDQFPAQIRPEWPTRMEFALSSACNLQCVMCSGEFSSSIRTHREGLPPLPHRYGAAFLDELTPFLEHLDQARFLGGEPFLAEINFRIWERMIDLGLSVDCNVTTNGTQWTPRVERVLEALPFSVGISLDGVSRETVEAVRAGASFDRLMQNLSRFVEYRDNNGSTLSLTFCLMVQNWHEFVDYLLLGESMDCEVFVNTVRQPADNSLYALPAHDLVAVVAGIERSAEAARDRLKLNGHALDEQLTRLRGHLSDLLARPDRGAHDLGVDRDHERLLDQAVCRVGDEDALVSLLGARSVENTVAIARCDADDVMVQWQGAAANLSDGLLGRSSSDLHQVLALLLGHRIDVVATRVGGGISARVLRFSGPDVEPSTVLTMVTRGPEPWVTTRFTALVERGAERGAAVTLRTR